MIAKRSKRFRFFVWFAVRVLRAPYTVDFTPPENDNVAGIAFTWDKETAVRMRANYMTLPQRPTRAARRAMKRAYARATTGGQR